MTQADLVSTLRILRPHIEDAISNFGWQLMWGAAAWHVCDFIKQGMLGNPSCPRDKESTEDKSLNKEQENESR